MPIKLPTLNSSTKLLINEAQQRGITVTEIPYLERPGFLLQLQHHREYIYHGMTNSLGKAAATILSSKMATYDLLQHLGYNVPASIATTKLSGLVQFLDQHHDIVVKPGRGHGGQGVSVGIVQQSELVAAFERAQQAQSGGNGPVIGQVRLSGEEYRILVVNYQRVFGLQRFPARVIGDGHQTIVALITQWNASVKKERQIKVTNRMWQKLAQQDIVPQTILPKHQILVLSEVANASAGGLIKDVTANLGPVVIQQARQLAQAVHCPVLGIDCISSNITQTLGSILELNPRPGLVIHHEPTQGQPQNVAGAVLDMLFPETVTY